MMPEGGAGDVAQPKPAMATGKKQRKLPPGFGQIIPTISVEVGGWARLCMTGPSVRVPVTGGAAVCVGSARSYPPSASEAGGCYS